MSKNSLLSGLKNVTNVSNTANGDKAYKSTLNATLDLFSRGGAMRGQEAAAVTLFDKAFGEDAELSLRCLFYLRDIREGQGEREFFRAAIKHLAAVNPAALRTNLHLISEYGRWDDLFVLLNTKLEKDVIALVKTQLSKDIDATNNGNAISLLARWLPSVVTSSKETVKQAQILARGLGLDEKTYRKTRSALNKRLNTVEISMSDKKFEVINYSTVPSGASKLYRNAFKKHDTARFESWQEEVKKNIELKASGKDVISDAKVCAATLYPYELVRDTRNDKYDSGIQNQWDSLPNFGGACNILVMADTSGSMECGRGSVCPIDISLSLAIYFAERNTGSFKNNFLTFSSVPQLVTLSGSNLQQKLRNIPMINANTDLRSAFNLVLSTANNNRVPAEDMPKAIVVISDMQFDSYSAGNSTLTDIKKSFITSGYSMPVVVWWNVNASDNSPCTADNNGNILVSGSSVNAFKALNKYLECNQVMTPVDMMLDVLNGGRYQAVSV